MTIIEKSDEKDIVETKIEKIQQNYRWVNCINKNCRRHIAKILFPNGLIEIRFSHGNRKQFRVLISGSIDYDCPRCGMRNIIAFIKFPRTKQMKYKKNIQAQEANGNS